MTSATDAVTTLPSCIAALGGHVDTYGFKTGSGLGSLKLQRYVQPRGQPDKWAILTVFGECINRDGDTEDNRLPSSRDADFMKRCRFDTIEEACAVLTNLLKDSND